MIYDFKLKPEFWWFVSVALATALFQPLVEFRPELIEDWRTWAVGIGAACVRAVAGAVLAYIAKARVTYGETERGTTP